MTTGWDFFVSYTQADRAWAEWIAWILEEDGHRVLVQAWDFVPGSNWTLSMQEGVTNATRTVAVLSSKYLESTFGKAEWLEAWRQDPDGAESKLIPVRVEDCERPGFLGSVVGIDVFNRPEARAKADLRRAVAQAIAGRAKPRDQPRFPGSARAIAQPAWFPGALPTVWKVAARNVNFTGRDDDLVRVHRELSAGTLTVHGLGGVGKSQLAIEYAHKHAGTYDLVWTIAAEEPATFPDQFTKLAKAMGLTPADDLPDQVHAGLSGVAGWLLIFDNANEVADIQPWLPAVPMPPGIPGHVIVTTRRGGFRSLGKVLDLEVIDRPAAVRLLRARAPHLEEGVAGEIAEELGRLPLALEQAAAFLDRVPMAPDEYLHDVGDIATVWNLSLDQIAAEDPAASQLLDIIAYLAPESIPVDLFTNHPDRLPEPLSEAASDPLSFPRIMGTLVDYSLVKHTPTGLQLHRLVQAAVRARQDDASPLMAAVTLLRADAPNQISTTPQWWARWDVLLPHVLAMAEHAVPLDHEADVKVSWLLGHAGEYLEVQGRITEAHKPFERSLAITEATYGRDHPNVAADLVQLALNLRKLGDARSARPLAERAVRIMETTHGPNHPSTAINLNSLALILVDLNDAEGARPLAERALHITETSYGPRDPDVAIRLTNLSSILLRVGEPAAAQALAERGLRINEAVYGADHLIVGIGLNNLAAILAPHDAAAARPLAERALAIAERIHRPDHPEIGIRLRTLAWILRNLGETEAAQQLSDRAKRIREANE